MVRLKGLSYYKPRLRRSKLFQFQYGAIKSENDVLNIALLTSFNSNMVRLKDNALQICNIIENSFNSNMVRLKAALTDLFDNVKLLFQFQYGAIKSYKKYHYRTHHPRFNSNMVRLKVW